MTTATPNTRGPDATPTRKPSFRSHQRSYARFESICETLRFRILDCASDCDRRPPGRDAHGAENFTCGVAVAVTQAGRTGLSLSHVECWPHDPARERRRIVVEASEAKREAPFNAPTAAAQIVRTFALGAICSAEMWAQLADVLSRGGVSRTLDALPQDLQARLRESYRERLLSFSTLRGHGLRRRIRNWCRRPG